MRLRFDNISSFGASNGLTFADGTTNTGTFDAPPPFPDIASGDYVAIIVEPDSPNSEIVWMEGPFTVGDSSSNGFIRGQEGSTGIAHADTPWVHGPTVFDFIPNFVGDGSPEGVVFAEVGQTYLDVGGYDGQNTGSAGMYIFSRNPDGSAVAATSGSNGSFTTPLVITTGVNDEFVFTPHATDTPETFTLAGGTYATDTDVLNAMAAALGESAEAFSTLVNVTTGGVGFIDLQAVTPGAADNGDTITPGANDATVDLGFTGNTLFGGGFDANTGWLQLGGTSGGGVVGLSTDGDGAIFLTLGIGGIWSVVFDADGSTVLPGSLQVPGFLQIPWTQTGGPYEMNGQEGVILCSDTVTLPPPSGAQGKLYWIKDTGSGTGSVLPNDGETIDGQSSIALAAFDGVLLTQDPDTGGWSILSKTGSGGGGGGGGTINGMSSFIGPDSPTTLAADGSSTNIFCEVASPPAWLDTSGDILEPGLYLAAITVTLTGSFTSPAGLILTMFAPFSPNVGQQIDIADLQASATQNTTLSQVFALGTGDIGSGFAAPFTIDLPTDATGELTFSVSLWQLASGAGSGSGVALGTQETLVASDAEFVNVDGTPVTQSGLPSSGVPSWMDGSGNITEPGLYLFQSILSNFQAATTPGNLLSVETPGNNDFGQEVQVYSYDDLATANFSLTQFFLLALGESDVPYASNTRVNQLAVTDATAGFDLVTVTARLAAGAGGGGGGGGSFPTHTGTGSPEGVVTATAASDTYQDTNTGAIYFFTGSPPSSTGWCIGVGEWASDASVPGFLMAGAGEAFVIAPGGGSFGISDTEAQGGGGTTNGVTWNCTGGDGSQFLQVQLGDTGQFFWIWSPDGTLSPGGPIRHNTVQEGAGAVDVFAADTVFMQGDQTLPALTTWGGISVTIKNTDPGLVSHTLTPDGTDPIDGVNAPITIASMAAVTLISDGGSGIWITSRA